MYKASNTRFIVVRSHLWPLIIWHFFFSFNISRFSQNEPNLSPSTNSSRFNVVQFSWLEYKGKTNEKSSQIPSHLKKVALATPWWGQMISGFMYVEWTSSNSCTNRIYPVCSTIGSNHHRWLMWSMAPESVGGCVQYSPLTSLLQLSLY